MGSEIISIAQEGFWPLAFELLERYPGNEIIEGSLVEGLLSRQGRLSLKAGSPAAYYAAARDEVERRIAEPDTPTSAQPWLEETRSFLVRKEQYERNREDDREAGY